MYNDSSTDLTIASVSKSDAGVYQCKAVNQAGVDLSQEVEITVMAETETTCSDEPIELIHPLGKNCQEEEVLYVFRNISNWRVVLAKLACRLRIGQ